MSEDATMDITLEGALIIWYVIKKLMYWIDTPYLIRVKKNSVAEGLICNQEEDEGLDFNQKDGGGSEYEHALNMNFGDSDDDVI